MAIVMNASLTSVRSSSSLLQRRDHASHAKVRSTIQRWGNTTKPRSLRLTMVRVIPKSAAIQRTNWPAYPPSAQSSRKRGCVGRARKATRCAPARSWMSAAWTTTATTGGPSYRPHYAACVPSFLSRIVAALLSADLGGLDTLAIHNRGTGIRMFARPLAHLPPQGGDHPLPRPVTDESGADTSKPSATVADRGAASAIVRHFW